MNSSTHNVRSSVCLSGTGVQCDHTVHFSPDLSLWLDSPLFWAPWVPDTKACPATPSLLLPVRPGREVGMDVQTRPGISCKNGWR